MPAARRRIRVELATLPSRDRRLRRVLNRSVGVDTIEKEAIQARSGVQLGHCYTYHIVLTCRITVEPGNLSGLGATAGNQLVRTYGMWYRYEWWRSCTYERRHRASIYDRECGGYDSDDRSTGPGYTGSVTTVTVARMRPGDGERREARAQYWGNYLAESGATRTSRLSSSSSMVVCRCRRRRNGERLLRRVRDEIKRGRVGNKRRGEPCVVAVVAVDPRCRHCSPATCRMHNGWAADVGMSGPPLGLPPPPSFPT